MGSATMGIRKFKLRMTQVRKMGKIHWNHSLIYRHLFPDSHPKYTCSWMTKWFTGRNNIVGKFAPFPSPLSQVTPMAACILNLSTVWRLTVSFTPLAASTPQEDNVIDQFNRILCEFRTNIAYFREEKASFPSGETNYNSSAVQPIAQSPYWLPQTSFHFLKVTKQKENIGELFQLNLFYYSSLWNQPIKSMIFFKSHPCP